MKIRITARPGELEARREDVERVLDQLTGAGACSHEPLEKAAAGDQGPRTLDYQVTQGLVDRARRRQVERIRRHLLARMQEIVD